MRVGKINGLWQPLRDTTREVRNRLRPPATVSLHYTMTATDEWGNPTERTRRYKAHSWTKQAAQILNMIGVGGDGITNENVKETDATFTLVAENALVLSKGAIDVNTSGIQCGTGVGAESSDNFVLGTLIANGSGANQLVYAAGQGFTPVQGITGGWRVVAERNVQNNSGASITVTEIGWVWSVTVFFLVVRDVLAVSETITNKTGRIIQYQIDFMN